MRTRFIAITLLGLAAASSCLAQGPTAYVVNTSAETLSKIDLVTGTVSNDILPIGSDLFSFPNQIVVRDTLAYVVASGTNEVQVINLNTEATVGFINIGDGTNPYWMTFLDHQYAYVSGLVSNNLYKVDVSAGTVVDSIALEGKGPEGMAIHDGKLYVALTGFDFNTFQYDPGMVAVIDLFGDSLLTKIPVGLNPQFIDVDRNGAIHVICTGDYFSIFGRAYIIDGGTDTVTDSLVLGGSPGMIAIGPNNIAAVAGGGFSDDGFVYSYSATSLDVYYDAANPITVDSGCTGVAWFQDSTILATSFKDVVRRVDSTGTVVTTYGLGDGPVHLDLNYVPGDINGDWVADPVDLAQLTDFLFAAGAAARWPIWRGDLNADGLVMDPIDLAYYVDYLFAGGIPPRVGATWAR